MSTDLATDLAELQGFLTQEAPPVAATRVLDWAVRGVARDAALWPALTALARVDVPAVWRALGTLALFPKFPDLRARARACLRDTLGTEHWRLEVARRASIALSRDFGCAGYTAVGQPRGVAWFKAALLEDAMLCGTRWPREVAARYAEVFAGLPLVWGAFRDDALVWAGRDLREAPEGALGVPHPLELGERLTSLRREDEPFAQTARWFDASHPDTGRRLDRGVIGIEIEDTLLFGRLRPMGWRRGEVMDFPRFLELHKLHVGRGDVRAFVRFSPGIAADGPTGESMQLLELGYTTHLYPPWGCSHDSAEVPAPVSPSDHAQGLRLDSVDPVVRSESRRALHLALRGPTFLPYSGRSFAPTAPEDIASAYARLLAQPDPDWHDARSLAEDIAEGLVQAVDTLRARWAAQGWMLRRQRLREPRYRCPRRVDGKPVPATVVALWTVLGTLVLGRGEPPDGWPALETLDPLSLYGVVPTRGLTLWPSPPEGGLDPARGVELVADHPLDPSVRVGGAPLLLASGEPARLTTWLRQIVLEQGGLGMLEPMPPLNPERLAMLTGGLPHF